MKGKELRNKIKKFSHKTNFYKLGLVKKYLKKQEQEKQKLVKAIPKVKCPKCGSSKISIGYDECEYISDSWLDCDDCDEYFKDTFGYIDAVEELKCLSWGDMIAIELHFEEPDIRTLEWQKFCETEIKKYLGLIKEEPIPSIF